jgi:hypothetical protein
MDKQNITFILSLWAAVLSTITALANILKSRKDIKGSLSVDYNFQSDASSFTITSINTSFRPLTILAYDLLYATQVEYPQLVKSCQLDTPVKLQESEMHRQTFTAEEVKAAAKENGVQQRYYQRLYVRISTTNAGVYYRLIDIPPLLSKTGKITDWQYICTDIFLGLPEKEPIEHRRAYVPIK